MNALRCCVCSLTALSAGTVMLLVNTLDKKSRRINIRVSEIHLNAASTVTSSVVNKRRHLSCTPTALSVTFGRFERPGRCLEECWNSENAPASYFFTAHDAALPIFLMYRQSSKLQKSRTTIKKNTLFTHAKNLLHLLFNLSRFIILFQELFGVRKAWLS